MRGSSLVVSLGAVWAVAFLAACSDTKVVGSDCLFGTLRCNGAQVEQCDASRRWVFQQDCATSGMSCSDGVCGIGGSCVLGATRCNGSRVERCDGQNYQLQQDCALAGLSCGGAGVCQAPADDCSTPGTVVCSADRTKVEVCLQGGGRTTTTTCPVGEKCDPATKTCKIDGTTLCSAGQKRCNPLNPLLVDECNTQGQFVPNPCPTGQACNPNTNQCGGSPDDDVTVEQEEEAGVPCTATQLCPNPADEYCDIPEGKETGTCRPFCSGPSDCPRGKYCDESNTQQCLKIPGYCTATRDCPVNQVCSKSAGASDGRCRCKCGTPGCNCQSGTRCIRDTGDPEKDGTCQPLGGGCETPCDNDSDCGAASFCDRYSGQTNGCCRPKCRSNADCAQAFVCEADGRCQRGTQRCDCGGACPACQVCDQIYCTCVSNCPQCPDGQYCDNSTCGVCRPCAPGTPCTCTNPALCGIGFKQCCAGYNCSAVVYGVLGFCI